MTRYVAEFINSLTNLVYSKKPASILIRSLEQVLICYLVFYAIYGLHKLWQKSNNDFFRALPYWGLMAVGICSAIFHVSLQYHTQMCMSYSITQNY